MKLKSFAFVFALLPLLMVSSPAKADLIIEFGQNGVAGANSFSTTAGAQVSVEVYLTQFGTVDTPFGTFTDTRLNNPGVNGFLFNFDVGGNGEVVHEEVGGISTFGFSAIFPNLPSAELAGQSLAVQGFTPVDPADAFSLLPYRAPTGVNSVLLGTAMLDVSDLASGSYGLTLRGTGLGSEVGLGPSPLEGLVSPTFGTGSLTITAIPEPSSVAVLGVACVGLLGFRRRQTRLRMTGNSVV